MFRFCSFLPRKNSFYFVFFLLSHWPSFCLVGVVPWLLSLGAETNPLAALRACRVVARWAVFSLLVVLLSSCFYVRAWLTCDRVSSLRLVVPAIGVAVIPQPPLSSPLLFPLPRSLPPRCPRTSRVITTTSVGRGRCSPKGDELTVGAFLA